MLPAPAQGAILVAARSTDPAMTAACRSLHHEPTAICTRIEKDFLRALRGGCTAPIGASARLDDGQIVFSGNLLTPDGSEELRIEQRVPLAGADGLGERCGLSLLEQGGARILDQSRIQP